jgi:hypothetical protein
MYLTPSKVIILFALLLIFVYLSLPQHVILIEKKNKNNQCFNCIGTH